MQDARTFADNPSADTPPSDTGASSPALSNDPQEILQTETGCGGEHATVPTKPTTLTLGGDLNTMALQNPEEPFFIAPPYDKLLRGTKEMPIGLYQLYKASAAQLTRLHYSEKSVKHVKALLRALADHDFVQFDARPTASYRSPYYYVLGNKGVEYVNSLGFSVSDSFQPNKEIGKGYLHLLHQMGVNDVLISAALLKQRVTGFVLADVKLGRELVDKPFHAMRLGKPYGILPDLFLDFRQELQGGKQRRTLVLLEHDRGTEQEEVIRRKVHAYTTMIKSEWYKTQFNMNSITVAFTTFEGEKRRDKLRAWAKEELKDEDTSLVATFLFTTQLQPPDPACIWSHPCWYSPFMEAKPASMLGGEL